MTTCDGDFAVCGGRTVNGKKVVKPKKMTANTIKNSVMSYFRFERQFTHLATELWDWDVAVSDGTALIEIEVKISWSDYREEFKKSRYHRSTPATSANRKYFAAPEELAQRIAKDEDTISRGYGVLGIEEMGRVHVVKRASELHPRPVTEHRLSRIIARAVSELITLRRMARK